MGVSEEILGAALGHPTCSMKSGGSTWKFTRSASTARKSSESLSGCGNAYASYQIPSADRRAELASQTKSRSRASSGDTGLACLCCQFRVLVVAARAVHHGAAQRLVPPSWALARGLQSMEGTF